VIEDAFVCPQCAGTYPCSERFCAVCGMPLVAGWIAPEPSAAARTARKIKPQYAEGKLMRAVGAANQTEAEFIQGMLLEEGVPSMVVRRRGFDVPDMLAAGPRDVMVPASGHAVAREVLLQAELIGEENPGTPPSQVLTFVLVAVAVVAVIAWVGTALLN